MKKHQTQSVINDMSSALKNLLYQTEQMQGMFPDEDGVIQEAIDEAYDALHTYKKHYNAIQYTLI